MNSMMSIVQIISCLLILNNMVQGCENYFQAGGSTPPSSASRRPFDVCYRSYRNRLSGSYSYKYICNESYYENYTVNGYTVFKQYYNGVGCDGPINATLFEDAPYYISCGGSDCDLVRYRVYDINPNDTTIGQCQDVDEKYPDSIVETNDYQERVHVIERCDDDGFVSDSYFCSDDYFYVNSYSNDKCDNNGIYAAAYYFEGCNDANQYVEVIECAKNSGLTSSGSGLKTYGTVFIVLALIAVICAMVFVFYHCKRTRAEYEIAR